MIWNLLDEMEAQMHKIKINETHNLTDNHQANC